jgi:hypothetical protein
MDSSHIVVLLIELMTIYIQGADVALKPGMIKQLYGNESASSSRGDVGCYIINRKSFFILCGVRLSLLLLRPLLPYCTSPR